MDGLSVGSLVTDGNLLLATAVAVLAGLVSFASPCVLPLVPGFLGYVTGLGADALPPARGRVRGDVPVGVGGAVSGGVGGAVGGAASGGRLATPPVPDERSRRRRVLLGTALFVAGFSAVFIAGTLAASFAGTLLAEHRLLLTRLGGVVVIALALVFLGVGARIGTQRAWQPRWRPAAGLVGAPLLGVVFGIGWAPCMGPTYGAILALATSLSSDSGQITRGAVLGVAYCAGLGVPFLLLAAGWSRAVAASDWLRRHHRGIQLCGGAILLVIGVLLLTGQWYVIVRQVQSSLVSSFTTPL